MRHWTPWRAAAYRWQLGTKEQRDSGASEPVLRSAVTT